MLDFYIIKDTKHNINQYKCQAKLDKMLVMSVYCKRLSQHTNFEFKSLKNMSLQEKIKHGN